MQGTDAAGKTDPSSLHIALWCSYNKVIDTEAKQPNQKPQIQSNRVAHTLPI